MICTVKRYIGSCDSCQQNKHEFKSTAGPLQSLLILEKRWETVTMNFITKLPISTNNNDACLVVVDKLSKRCHLIPMKETFSAEQIAQLYHSHVFRHHEMSTSFIFDRGSVFTGNF